MASSKFQNLLSKQALILSVLKDQLQVVHFIRWGYENDLPILINNHFLFSVSHQFYRSAILSVCALFDNHKYQSNNFHLLVDDTHKFSKEIEVETKEKIKEKLTLSTQHSLPELIRIRNEEIGHFQFLNKASIQMNHRYLSDLISLYKIADEIIIVASKGTIDKDNSTTHFIGLLGDDLNSLQKLLKKASGIDYSKTYIPEL
jgi:hypothetical protein